MSKWKVAIKSRFQITIILFTVGLFVSCIPNIVSVNGIFYNVAVCIGTSLISASVTIFLVKFDIMDELKNSKINDYGIIDIKDGRDNIFNEESISNLNYNGWKEFLKKSSDRTIDIVGISMYSFFYHYNLIDYIVGLSQKGYKIRIVFANPESREVELQSIEERKQGKLKDNILFITKELIQRINKSDKKNRIKNNLDIFYSETLPRYFIVRSGDKMIITPYLLKGPFDEPTIIVNKWCTKEYSYYKAYITYIEGLVKSAAEKKV